MNFLSMPGRGNTSFSSPGRSKFALRPTLSSIKHVPENFQEVKRPKHKATKSDNASRLTFVGVFSVCSDNILDKQLGQAQIYVHIKMLFCALLFLYVVFIIV